MIPKDFIVVARCGDEDILGGKLTVDIKFCKSGGLNDELGKRKTFIYRNFLAEKGKRIVI